ncbi:unnamed protein product, partial [Ranitomeya imitator]
IDYISVIKMHFGTNLPAGRFGGRTAHAPAILEDGGAREKTDGTTAGSKDTANVKEPQQPSTQDSSTVLDKTLVDHFTPEILKSAIKSNPLYKDVPKGHKVETKKKQPSWTVQDYDSQLPNPKLSLYMKENPHDLHYWLEDIYTPGYDSLLKKKEKEQKNSKYCKLFAFLALLVCILIAIVTVTVLFT